ncbi:snRNA-activating protein complex subunit 1 isoform X1 [Balearica regulorum gibbericeps]|uniref:snRNA-activating protein complex subunit 1 isoform X1 n=1 Tax=Balearica regulorum gibbericeps TaxID=100784 RepID=UPI003F6355D9
MEGRRGRRSRVRPPPRVTAARPDRKAQVAPPGNGECACVGKPRRRPEGVVGRLRMRTGQGAERRRDELGAGAAGGLRGAARRLPGGRHRPLRALRRAVAGAPLPHHLLIRIALKDWPEIQKFQQDLIDSQHYDAAYIFRTLRLARAFHFTAMPKLLNYRTKKRIQENEFKEEFKDPSNRVNSLITNDVLEELMNIHDHYQKMKCVISADKSQPDKALSLIKDEFVVTLKDITLEHQEWQQNRMKLFLNAKETDEISNKKEEGTLLELEGSERANALARIKYRSYSAVVEASKSRRHRQVRLESSESGSNYGKSPSRSKKNSRRPQPARIRDSLEIKGEMQVAKETVTRHIGMPIITEEENSDEEVSLPKRKRR